MAFWNVTCASGLLKLLQLFLIDCFSIRVFDFADFIKVRDVCFLGIVGLSLLSPNDASCPKYSVFS